MKKLIGILGIAIGLSACQKEESQRSDLQNGPEPEAFSELVISKDFNWSSGNKGAVRVIFESAQMNLTGAEVQVVTKQGEVLERQKLHNGSASFYLNYPQNNSKLYFYLPASMERWEITQSGTIRLNVTDPFSIDPAAGSAGNKGKMAMNNPVSGTNVLGNADFETDDFTRRGFTNFGAIAGDGKWYYDRRDIAWINYNGSKAVKGQKGPSSYLYQSVSVTESDSMYIKADMDGPGLAFAMYYNSAGDLIEYSYVYPNNNIVYYAGVVPSNAKTAVVLLVVNKNIKVDNAFLSNPAGISDSDYDGVADNLDEFPNDHTRAYTTTFPTVGTQTLAFEDLWPSKGDYDFNDMVISSKITFVKNGNGDFVEASAWVSIDAKGAGLENGLGLLFVDASKQKIGKAIIATVSGDATADPDNQNGIIVWSRPSDILSSNYTNTVAGNYTTPDTARFTITFKSDVDESSLLPDLYLFRSNERGREIHLAGFSGTAAANSSYYNTGEDVNGTYLTGTGLPWVMEIINNSEERFKHPLEKVDILDAYPQFAGWAQSVGQQNKDWRLYPNTIKVADL